MEELGGGKLEVEKMDCTVRSVKASDLKQSTINVICLNHPKTPTWCMEKLFSTKSVPAAEKAGDPELYQ